MHLGVSFAFYMLLARKRWQCSSALPACRKADGALGVADRRASAMRRGDHPSEGTLPHWRAPKPGVLATHQLP